MDKNPFAPVDPTAPLRITPPLQPRPADISSLFIPTPSNVIRLFDPRRPRPKDMPGWRGDTDNA
jgi:hypothetical protein